MTYSNREEGSVFSSYSSPCIGPKELPRDCPIVHVSYQSVEHRLIRYGVHHSSRLSDTVIQQVFNLKIILEAVTKPTIITDNIAFDTFGIIWNISPSKDTAILRGLLHQTRYLGYPSKITQNGITYISIYSAGKFLLLFCFFVLISSTDFSYH